MGAKRNNWVAFTFRSELADNSLVDFTSTQPRTMIIIYLELWEDEEKQNFFAYKFGPRTSKQWGNQNLIKN